MSDPNATAELERSWLAWLGQHDDQIMNYLNSWDWTVALTPTQLQAIASRLDLFMQDLTNARRAAEELTRQGAPTFAQRLDTAIQTLQGTRGSVQQMYSSAAITQAQIAQIQQNKNQAIGQIYSNMANSSIAARNQNHQEYIDRLNGNCLTCHMPIGIPGGGYCALHGPRSG